MFRDDLKKREFELWKKWRETGDDRYAAELLASLDPLIMSEVSKYSSTRVPPNAVRAEAYRLAYEALKSYSPSRGTSVSTWVGQWLRKLQRFVIETQNVARIPERSVSMITAYKNAVDELKEILGRDPSADELAAHLGWPLKDVLKMSKMLARDILVPDYVATEDEPFAFRKQVPWSTFKEDLEAFYVQLTPEEQKIFEGLIGFPSGKPKPLTQIAREMGLDYGEATRIKRQLAKKVDEFWLNRPAAERF